MHIIDFGPAVIFGFFYFIKGDLNFSKLRALAAPDAVEHVVEDEELMPTNISGEGKALENAVSE